MAVHSKPTSLSLPYNCYELYHTWQPDCLLADVNLGYNAMIAAIPLNAPLYLISQIFQRKFDFRSFLNTFQNTCRTSLSLGFHAFAIFFFFCLLSKLMGKVYFYTPYCSSFIASFLAILIEKRSRRRTLALYTSNVASDTLFRMAVSRGKLKPIPGGEVYLFSLTMALLLYSARKRGFAKDYVSQGIKYILGNAEAKSSRGDDIAGSSLVEKKSTLNCKIISSGTLLSRVAAIWKILWEEVKHHSCPHDDTCCHYVAMGFLRPFLLGCATLGAASTFRLSKAILKNPANFFRLLMKNSTNFGLFLGGFTGTFRLLSCCLRWLLGKDREVFAIPAALVGGLFMKFFPSSTIALNLAWKLIEITYLVGMEEGILPEIKGAMVVLFAISTAFIMHAAVFEPHNLRASYIKFLERLSCKKVWEFNRHAFDHFGCQSSKLHPNDYPNLDHKFTSKAYRENHLLNG